MDKGSTNLLWVPDLVLLRLKETQSKMLKELEVCMSDLMKNKYHSVRITWQVVVDEVSLGESCNRYCNH